MAHAIREVTDTASPKARISGGLISYQATHAAGRRYLYVAPATLLFCLLMLFPMVTVFRYSLLDGAIVKKNAGFVGFENYREIFADPVFWQSVGNTLYFTVMSVIFHLLVGLAFALLLNSRADQPGAPEHPAGALHPAVAVHGGDHRDHLAAAARSERRHQQRPDDARTSSTSRSSGSPRRRPRSTR